MKAYRLSEIGSFDHLRMNDEETPTASRGEVLIRVRAASLNFRDLAMANGQYPLEYKAGLVPLSDGAGEVIGVGDGVTSLSVGDRVVNTYHPRWFGGVQPADAGRDQYGSNRDGWLAEYKVVSQEAVVPFPEHLSFPEAATLPCAAVTAWSALHSGAPVGPGRAVLTQGTGGVALFAVQLAKLMGAQVISTTSSEKKAKILKGLGADHVINYNQTPAWGERAHELAGEAGVHRVVEIGGGGTLSQSMKAVGPGGEIALIGFLASLEDSSLDFFELFLSSTTFRVLSVGDRAGLVDMIAAIEQSGLRPVVDSVHPFDGATGAYRHLASGAAVGKVVISI